MTEATKTLSHRQTEALDRAISSASFTNYPAIYQGFLAKGIREDEIKPRENVFTFNAWKAKGRSVRKGEHGIKVVTFIECSGVEIRLVAKRRRLAIVAHTPQRSFTSLRLSQQAKGGIAVVIEPMQGIMSVIPAKMLKIVGMNSMEISNEQRR
jgi:hypothetical protein